MSKTKFKPYVPADQIKDTPAAGVFKAFSTLHTPGETLPQKLDRAREYFISLFGEAPDLVYFAKPHGTIIEAGPIPGTVNKNNNQELTTADYIQESFI